MKANKLRIALLGGTFNPLHNGHAMLAETAVKELGYDKILIVPAFIPPHKIPSGTVMPEDRLGMVQAFCADSDHFAAEDCEIMRGGVSYTYDTLQYIIQKYKNIIEGKPAFIVGQETAAEFDKWYHAADVAGMADIIIARRNDDNRGNDTAAFGNKPAGTYTGGFNSSFRAGLFQYPCILLNNPVMSVSSTEIRTRIAGGKSWRYLVPEPVFQYIIERKLYGYK
ncbi:MAG: nicotinate (nicotinamide) nucleotide adenylyltransferase [Treponema sp.]